MQKLRLKDSFGLLPGARTLLSATPRAASGIDDTPASSGSEAPVRTGVSALQTYRVIGQPEDIDGARELAANDRYGFQWWILPLIGAKAYGAESGQQPLEF